MNKEQLLADTLDNDDGAQFARAAAAYARRQRALRHAGITAGLVASAAAFLLTVGQPPLRPVPVIAPSTPALEIISDQELMAQLEGQPVLFVKGSAGITAVVLIADNQAGR